MYSFCKGFKNLTVPLPRKTFAKTIHTLHNYTFLKINAMTTKAIFKTTIKTTPKLHR